MTSYDKHEQSLNELLPIAKALYDTLRHYEMRTEAMGAYEMFDTKYRLRHGRTVTQQIESLPPYDWAEEGDFPKRGYTMKENDDESFRRSYARHPANALQEKPPPSNAPRQVPRQKSKRSFLNERKAHLEEPQEDVSGTIRRASAEAHVEEVKATSEEGETEQPSGSGSSTAAGRDDHWDR